MHTEAPAEISKTTLREIALFQAGDVICGLDTAFVQEINKHTGITIVHRAPDYVRGVINLRGAIVTIVDLRKKLGMDPVEIHGEMQIVVVTQGGESIGLLVDRIHDVIAADPADIEPPPPNLAGIEGLFFEGIFKREKELVAVLNIRELLRVRSEINSHFEEVNVI